MRTNLLMNQFKLRDENGKQSVSAPEILFFQISYRDCLHSFVFRHGSPRTGTQIRLINFCSHRIGVHYASVQDLVSGTLLYTLESPLRAFDV